MNIKSIKAVPVDLRPSPSTTPRVPRQDVPDWVSPTMMYTEFSKSDFSAAVGRTACVVTADDDGTWGLGITINAAPVNSIINDQFAPILVGQNCMATRKGLGHDAARHHSLWQRRPGELRHQCGR